ncbi:zinc finger protein 813-like, partial [Nilaparvata lugens]|uniref:zinc finger protein 813-like n=1 Tax=Nilaparvata lugens TaxID=108931 RepID=UPI00193D5DBB
SQFGFREGLCTELALRKSISEISNNINRKDMKRVAGMFLDIRKAFDTVNYEILLRKLKLAGVRGLPLAWFHSYLHGRSQAVKNPQFRCELCTKSFYRKDSLKKHFKERHSTATTSSEPSQAQFSCSQCGKNFKSQSALVFHLQTHNGDFKFQCENCNKCFVRKCHFESHMRSHSESRPYKCSTCGRGFKEKKHWKVHLRRVHTNEITMQSLLDSITSEAALCTDNTDMMHHPVLQANDCLAISQSYIINAGIELQHM